MLLTHIPQGENHIMSDRSTVIKKIVGIQEDWAVKLRLYKLSPTRLRVEDWALKLRYPLQSAEADIVCVDAVSTAV